MGIFSKNKAKQESPIPTEVESDLQVTNRVKEYLPVTDFGRLEAVKHTPKGLSFSFRRTPDEVNVFAISPTPWGTWVKAHNHGGYCLIEHPLHDPVHPCEVETVYHVLRTVMPQSEAEYLESVAAQYKTKTDKQLLQITHGAKRWDLVHLIDNLFAIHEPGETSVCVERELGKRADGRSFEDSFLRVFLYSFDALNLLARLSVGRVDDIQNGESRKVFPGESAATGILGIKDNKLYVQLDETTQYIRRQTGGWMLDMVTGECLLCKNDGRTRCIHPQLSEIGALVARKLSKNNRAAKNVV